MVSERFKSAVWDYRRAGGRLYRLAIDHEMAPSMLSATIAGARRINYDPRIVQIGEQLGLKPEECFEPDDTAVAS